MKDPEGKTSFTAKSVRATSQVAVANRRHRLGSLHARYIQKYLCGTTHLRARLSRRVARGFRTAKRPQVRARYKAIVLRPVRVGVGSGCLRSSIRLHRSVLLRARIEKRRSARVEHLRIRIRRSILIRRSITGVYRRHRSGRARHEQYQKQHQALHHFTLGALSSA